MQATKISSQPRIRSDIFILLEIVLNISNI